VVASLNIEQAIVYASDEDTELLREIAERKSSIQSQQDIFAVLCDRFDNLYYPSTVLEHAGASHWAEHPSAHTIGKSHISINVPPAYVDIPASLQSVTPVLNMIALVDTEEGRHFAALAERLYMAWSDEDSFDLKAHQACVVKSLYGRTAGKVFWDAKAGRPTVRIVDQPRNLYLGWGNSDYTRLDWALYTYRQSAEAVYEDWGLEVQSTEEQGNVIPFVLSPGADPSSTNQRWLHEQHLEVEVYDYWYRRPKKRVRKSSGEYGPVEHETWNCIFVGNIKVKQERHAEYDGKIPYVPLFNTYVPGVPDGKAELYDVESLLREKDERLTQGSQLLAKAVDGQLWQLVGPEAPDVVPSEAIPKPNKVSAPGPGNRVENITPWMPEFQLEAFLSRLDREITDVTGLNDLLRGLAPTAVLSSSKAINALVSNYEARIRIKRDLFYRWWRQVWDLCATVWTAKASALAPVLQGVARLQLTAPSLTPRDDLETASMASNLVIAKLWSQKRGMDRVGVDDPEVESDIIRAERTDASMFPQDVQVMAQLMLVLQQLGYNAGPAQQQLGAQAQSLNDVRQSLGGRTGSASLNGPGEAPLTPPEGGPPAPEGGLPEPNLQAQTLVQEGEAQNRLVSSQQITGG
jgi:hypothetical protein